MKKTFICILSLLAFAGCNGIRFADVPINNQPPESLKDRNVFEDRSGLYKYHPTQLVGWCVYLEPDADSYEFKRVALKPDYIPTIEIISETEGKIYDGTIDSGASASGSYLIVAASLNAKQVATVSIRDWASVFVKNDDIPWDMLARESATPKANVATKRYWIQGALLTAVYGSVFQEATGEAKFAGPTFGANGKVYSRSTEEIHDYLISVQLIDIDGLATELAAPAMIPLGAEERIRRLAQTPALMNRIAPKGLSIRPREVTR